MAVGSRVIGRPWPARDDFILKSLDGASISLQIGTSESQFSQKFWSHHVLAARRQRAALPAAGARAETGDSRWPLQAGIAPAGDARAGARARPVAQYGARRVRATRGRGLHRRQGRFRLLR